MLSLVEPYLTPLAANADVCRSFTMRKRILSEDQQDALEFLFALDPKRRHTSLQLNSASGKTKLVLFYYEWLKSEGRKVSVICYNKKKKYALYANRLDIKGYSKHDFLGKKTSLRVVDVIILDQSGFCKKTLRANQDRVSTLLSISDRIQVIEIQSDWNGLLAENVFARKRPLSNRCKFQLQPYLLAEGRYLSTRTKTLLEACQELCVGEATQVMTTAPVNAEVATECLARGVDYRHFQDKSMLNHLEAASKLVLICDTSHLSSAPGLYSLYCEVRYLFYRFINNFRHGREVSVVVIVPTEESMEMGFCMSLLMTLDEVEQASRGMDMKNPKSNYRGLRPPSRLNLFHLIAKVYDFPPLPQKWSVEPIDLDANSYFQVEGESVTVCTRAEPTAPFDFETQRFEQYLLTQSEEAQTTLFCGEELAW